MVPYSRRGLYGTFEGTPEWTPNRTQLLYYSRENTDARRKLEEGLRLVESGMMGPHEGDPIDPTRLFQDLGSRIADAMTETPGNSMSKEWYPALRPNRGEADPHNYQWYIQQMAQNKGDELYSTQKGIREANEFGGAPLGNDILHPSRVVDLPKQRRQGVFDPIRESAIAQGLIRPVNRWREKLKVPHKQRMVAQQSRADLMCLQRWRPKSGPDYPEMLAINPNIAPLTAMGERVRGGYHPYRKTGARQYFGPYS